MAKPATVEPQWVLYNDELCNVGDFARLPPKARPDVTCPLCSQPVVLKLGKIKAHHYAHREEANCTASHPETALHLNTKYHFAKELERAIEQQATQLFIKQPCQAPGCEEERNKIWLEGWNQVKLEHRIDPIRPDIALLLHGQVVAALEIRVTHAVDEHKAAHLLAHGVQWLEIQADASLYEGEAAWRVTSPLPLPSEHRDVQSWTCPTCLQKQEDLIREQAELERQRIYKERNYTTTHVDRMVDFYFPTSEKHREIFIVMRVVRDGHDSLAILKSERRGELASAEGPLTQETLNQFSRVVDSEIEDLKVKDTIVDNVLPWRRWREGSQIKALNLGNFPFRYYWDARQNLWVRLPSSSSTPAYSSTRPNHSSRHGSYPCIWCGQVTSDWYHYDGKGHCRCNDCARKHRAEVTKIRP